MNMVFNETLPIVSDEVFGGGIQAVAASVVLIIVFGPCSMNLDGP